MSRGEKKSINVLAYFMLSLFTITFSWGLIQYFLNSNVYLCAISFLALLIGCIFLIATQWAEREFNYNILCLEKFIVFIIVPCTYITFKFLLLISHEPVLFYDSQSYLNVPNWRSITVPLFYSILNYDPDRIVFFQIFFAIFSSLSLAIVLYYIIKDKVVRLIAPLVLLLSTLSYSILEWEIVLISESISLSLFMLLVAVFLLAYQQYEKIIGMKYVRGIVFTVCAILIFFFSNARDSNMYVLLVCLPVLFFFSFSKKYRKIIISLIVVMVITIVYQSWDSGRMEVRWLPPVMNSIYKHAMVDNGDINYFINANMPISKETMNYNLTLSDFHEKFYRGNEEFRNWLINHGKNTYMKYLISHPVKVNINLINEMGSLFDNGVIRNYVQDGIGKFSETLDKIFFFSVKKTGVILTMICVVIPSLLLFFNKRYRSLYILTLISVVFFYSQTFVGYYGDGQEFERHVLFGNILFRVTLFLTICCTYFGLRSNIQLNKK